MADSTPNGPDSDSDDPDSNIDELDSGADESNCDTDESDPYVDDSDSDADPSTATDDEPDLDTIGVAVLTVSSDRSIDEDTSGDTIAELVDAAGHSITTRELIPGGYDRVQSSVDSLSDRDDTDAIVVVGGTGVAPDDVTVEAVRPLFDKELPGFGELFRSLAREEIGTRIVATRTTAGVADGTPVFCLPGRERAARLGTAEIVVPEIEHLVALARTHDSSD